jgi:hypothetical protein
MDLKSSEEMADPGNHEGHATIVAGVDGVIRKL